MNSDGQKATNRLDAGHEAADGRNDGLAVALIDGVGDWISVLIVRDALAGLREPAEFQRSLGAPQDVIADRLHALVDLGILAQRTPAEHLGAGYVLTDKGNELAPVLTALSRWGRVHLVDGQLDEA